MISIILSELNPSTITLDIVEAITELEKDVDIILLGDVTQDHQEAYTNLNCRIKHLKSTGPRKFISYLIHFVRLVIHFRKSGTDKLYASGRNAAFLAMLAGFFSAVPRRVFTRHHGAENHLFEMKRGILLDKITNFFATEIIAVSVICKEILVSRENVNPVKVTVIHNAIDHEKFSLNSRHFLAQNIKPAFKEYDVITVGMIGRSVPGKGIGIALAAFSLFLFHFPNAKLRLIGCGKSFFSDNLNILEQIPPDNIEVIPHTSDTVSEYQIFDYFLHVPEFSDFESFGLVYLEAIASGVPSIFTLSGILNEITCPNFVQVVESRNIEETYRALLNFSEFRPLSFKDESEKVASSFDVQNMTARYTKVVCG
jgi:glycosyltransferase involved in cell wall biosynthesis